MLATLRYVKGQGNAAIYARARNTTAQFWDFVGLAWVAAETADTRRFLTEYPDADVLESRYQTTFTPPTGTDVVLEYVKASDGSVLAEDGPSLLASAALRADDARLDRLDVAVSSRASSGEVAAVAPDNAGITAIRAKTDAFLDVATSTRSAPADIPPVPADVMRNTDPRLDHLAAINTKVDALAPLVLRTLSLAGANTVRDQEVFDAQGRTISARIRSYDTAAHATEAGSSGLLATYAVAATYTITGATTMTVTEVIA